MRLITDVADLQARLEQLRADAFDSPATDAAARARWVLELVRDVLEVLLRDDFGASEFALRSTWLLPGRGEPEVGEPSGSIA
jgi:hypothetical protein